jgi:hypothetical protein
MADRDSNSDHSAHLAVWRSALMAKLAQVVVLKRRGKWCLKAEEVCDIFPDQRAAMKAGIDLAHEVGKNGKPSAVLFQIKKNAFKTVWTYGVDSYPPTRSGLPEICAAKTGRRTTPAQA